MNDNVSNWTDQVRDGVGESLRKVVVGIPDILAAILVFVIGLVVATVAKAAVVRLVQAVKLKPLADRIGWDRVFQGKFNLAELLGDLVKWFFIIVFLLQALTIAHLQQVNDVVRALLAYVPNVIVAAVLVFVGAVVADLTSRVVSDAARAAGATTAAILGDVAKYAIWTLVVFTTLAQLGVNTLFLDRLFTAIVVMVAIAGGLAFGLGGQDTARGWIDKVTRTRK